MKADKGLVDSKIAIIDERLKFLAEEDFDMGADMKTSLAIKHALQEVIEACLDIANHIISAESMGLHPAMRSTSTSSNGTAS